MSSYTRRNSIPFNGSLSYTITAQDVTDETITFDFDTSYKLVAIVQIKSSTGTIIDCSGLIVNDSVEGKFTISLGTSTGVFVAGNVLSIIGERDSEIFK